MRGLRLDNWLIAILVLVILGSTSSDMWVTPVKSKGITIEAPTSSEDITLFYVDDSITIIQTNEVQIGTSPTLTYNLISSATRDGTPDSLWTTNRYLASKTGDSTAVFDNAGIAAGRWIWLITSASTGTVDQFSLTIEYKK